MKNLNFLQFLQDEKGIFSSTRLAFLLWTVGVLVVWVVGSLKGPTLLHIDNSVILIISAFMTGKVVQKYAEKSDGASVEGAQPETSPSPKTGGASMVPARVTT